MKITTGSGCVLCDMEIFRNELGYHVINGGERIIQCRLVEQVAEQEWDK